MSSNKFTACKLWKIFFLLCLCSVIRNRKCGDTCMIGMCNTISTCITKGFSNNSFTDFIQAQTTVFLRDTVGKQAKIASLLQQFHNDIKVLLFFYFFIPGKNFFCDELLGSTLDHFVLFR